MRHSITGKIASASGRVPPTMLLEHKCSLDPGITAAIGVRNAGGLAGGKQAVAVPGNPSVDAGGRDGQKDGHSGTSTSYEWRSCQHLLLKPESYFLKLASARLLCQAKDLIFSGWTCWSDRTGADSCEDGKQRVTWKEPSFHPSF